jgi:hypothetical protein
MSNEDVIKERMKEFMATKVNVDVLSILRRVADRIILYLENEVIPVETGNLQDSTGVGIYHGDVLKRYIPRKTAVVSRSNIYPDGLTARSNVWGTDELQNAINLGAMKYSNDYHLVIYSAMPYAGLVEVRTGYFKAITDEIRPLFANVLMQVNK